MLCLMKSPRFLIPVILFIVATPLFLLGGIASAGRWSWQLCFCQGLLSVHDAFHDLIRLNRRTFYRPCNRSISLYGLLIGTANEKRKFVPYTVGLVIIHAMAIVACFLLVRENFS